MADNVIFNSKVSVEQLNVNGADINNVYATKKELEEITATGGDGNTKYTLSKSGSLITLTGTDGSTSSVSDTDTHIEVVDSLDSTDTTRPASANATRIAYGTASSAVNLANNAQATADSKLSNKAAYASSPRDFVHGTLITTDIDYSQKEGAAFYLEIVADTYGNLKPMFTQAQGYIYDNTIINYGMINHGCKISELYAMNVNGVLCFWFPRISYWQSFGCKVTLSNGGDYNINHVVSVTDSRKPDGTKVVNLHDNQFNTICFGDSGINAEVANGLSTICSCASGESSNKIWYIYEWEANQAWTGLSALYAICNSETAFNGILSVKFRNGNSSTNSESYELAWVAASKDPPTAALTRTANSSSVTYRLYINFDGAWKTFNLSKISEINSSLAAANLKNVSVTSMEGDTLASSTSVAVGYADRAGTLTDALPADKLPIVPVSKGGTGATDLAGITKLLCDSKPNTAPKYIIGLDESYQGNGYTTIQQLRNTMGLGNTTGALPIANGGTGATTADGAIANLGGVKKSGDTMTGKLQVNAPIFGYNYTNGSERAAFVFDKPGDNFTGIGANGENDTIYFGAVSSGDTGAWIHNYKQKWKFNGDVVADTMVSGNIYPSGNYVGTVFPGDEGWYRIYTSDDQATDSTGRTSCSFTIGRSYYSPQNEQYDFSVSVGYSGDINITQLSGVQGGHLITKIRVVYYPSSKFYIDFYTRANSSDYQNTYYVYNCSGMGQFQSPARVESIPDGYLTHEFETVTGCKSDRGFVGDLRGNAATASVASVATALGRNGVADAPMTFNWSGQGGQPTWLWGGEDASNMYVYNPSNFSVNYANSAGTIDGFIRTDSCTWGNQTGTAMMELATSSGGGIQFRDDNPSAGKVSMLIDGTVYVNEGVNEVIHTGNIGSQSVNYANSAGSVAWGNVSGKPNTFPPDSHTHSYITAGDETGGATVRSNDRDKALITGGWSTHDAGYGSQYGTTLDISGYSSWYQRLAFHTNGDIDYWQGINTKTLSKVGRIITSANIGSQSVNYANSAATVLRNVTDNTDVNIWKVYSDNDGEYGFRLQYDASGSGNNNSLSLVADNQNGTEVVAMKMLQDGTTTFSQTITASGGINGNASSATKATQDGNGNTITSTYLPLSGGTMTGRLLVNAPIISYNFTNGNNLAAFIFDKPGANFTGIGANGDADTIYFGAVSNRDTGAWDHDYKQKWKFNGTVIADTLSGSLAWGNVSGRPTALSQFTNDKGFITSSDSCKYATSAGSVAWGNVTSRPTALSQFTNDKGFITSSGTCANATTAVNLNSKGDDIIIKNDDDGYIHIIAADTNGYSGIVFHDGGGNSISLQEILDYMGY